MLITDDLEKFFNYHFSKGFLKININKNLLQKITILYNDLYAEIMNKIPVRVTRFEDIFKLLKEIISNFVSDRDLSKILAYKFLGLFPILPFLVNNSVNEIFIDGKTGSVIVDHYEKGRLRTNIRLTSLDLEKLILVSKLQSDSIVSETNPSLKTLIATEDFIIRISIDFPPLVESPKIDIRKLLYNANLSFFIKNDDDIEKLSVLMLYLALRKNILIVGEPGSGKTTLSTILLANTPDYWRIIAIEDVRELSLNRENLIKIRVKPFESSSRYSKEQEILKLLHRSPDYVFIGELQDVNDFKAYFHALSAGIRCMATTHSDNPHNLINRILNTFKIPENFLYSIDVVVFMDKLISDEVISRKIRDVFISDSKKKKMISYTDYVFNKNYQYMLDKIKNALYKDPLKYNIIKEIVNEIYKKFSKI